MPRTPSLSCSAQFVDDALYTHYRQLLQQYRAAPPATRQALLPAIGWVQVLSDEIARIVIALEELEDTICSRPDKGKDEYQVLGKSLIERSEALRVSPELAAYLQDLPQRERERGLSQAQELCQQPKFQKKKANVQRRVREYLESIPERYEASSRLSLALLTLEHAVSTAHQIIKQRGKLGQISNLFGLHGEVFFYDITPPRMNRSADKHGRVRVAK
ncbi:hypothetical protein [Hymenobacter radiodurans]|uniref:hypothetical protein n=1 Tax=Hymenobacter radiodurans TaxID=2496028 RepID=UPI0010588206|nr:hypothetical protein [Hymenobacter radiodurans]